MREFALAALPWVLAGLAVVILCASRGKKGQGAEDERLATGMALAALTAGKPKKHKETDSKL